jgi:Heterokaryon incompatibility protein (HET)
LIRTPLKDSPEYVAVSYAWGDSQSSQRIFIDGNAFAVRENAFQALSRLRSKDTARIIWIDIICINQNDSEEKSQQIPLMRDLYNQARTTFVWLGTAADDSDTAMSFIGTSVNTRKLGLIASLAGMLSVADEATLVSPASLKGFRAGYLGRQHYHIPSLDEQTALLPRDPHLRTATEKLLLRPWFRRPWIVQEFLLAQSVILVCGDSEVEIHGQNLEHIWPRDPRLSRSFSLDGFFLSSDRTKIKARLGVDKPDLEEKRYTESGLLDLAIREDWSSSIRSSSLCPSLSDTSSMTPRSSRPSTPGLNSPQGAREELVDLFAENASLNGLLSAAIADGTVGLEQLEEHLQQRLEELASDLHRSASSQVEAEIARFVRHCSQYTAQQLVLRQDPQHGRLASEILSHRARESRQQAIGRSILTEFKPPKDLLQPDDIEEVVSYPDFRAQFERIRRFFFEGDPYQKWIERMEEYVSHRRLQSTPLPKNGVETSCFVDQGVPRADARVLDARVNHVEANSNLNMVEFLGSFPNMQVTRSAALAPLSLIDRAKGRIEHMVGEQIAWWPLKPREKECLPGHSRVSWTCVRSLSKRSSIQDC